MTRINLGVDPEELCDQHLVAEYHELPRVFAYVERPNLPQGGFRLGKGHVLWCARYPGTMADRYRDLVREMRYRGFTVNHPEPRPRPNMVLESGSLTTADQLECGPRATPVEVLQARDAIIERIILRLGTMRGSPRWTRRGAPTWAIEPEPGALVVSTQFWASRNSSFLDGRMGVFVRMAPSGHTWIDLGDLPSPTPVARARLATPEERSAYWLEHGGHP